MKLWNRRSKIGEEFIADGGSAMMAYARMQFKDVTQEEREAVFNALLDYCELDTLVMVMIVEAWKGLLGSYERS